MQVWMLWLPPPRYRNCFSAMLKYVLTVWVSVLLCSCYKYSLGLVEFSRVCVPADVFSVLLRTRWATMHLQRLLLLLHKAVRQQPAPHRLTESSSRAAHRLRLTLETLQVRCQALLLACPVWLRNCGRPMLTFGPCADDATCCLPVRNTPLYGHTSASMHRVPRAAQH